MFWAINKITKSRVSSINVEFSDIFYEKEKWLADPIEIISYPPEIDINNIEAHYRKESKEIISKLGKIFIKRSHFFIPNAKKRGINVKEQSNEHKQCVNFIYSLLRNNKIKIIYSIVKEKSNNEYENVIILNNKEIDFNKLNYETRVIKGKYKIFDIIIPLKKYHHLLGFGICIEVQLTEQSDEKELERSYERANKGYSVCWINKDKLEIKEENITLIDTTIKIQDFNSILQKYHKQTKNEIKELTINYSKILDEKLDELKEIAKSIEHPLTIPCPKCDGLLAKRSGPYGVFYGCSNYNSEPKCEYKIPIK